MQHSVIHLIPSPSNPDVERTEVIHGSERVIGAELRFFSEAKSRIDTCMDSTRPALAIELERIRRSFVEAKRNGVQLRYLTEITNDNLSSCKEIIKITDELRHLDGIKGNFMISESEYLAPITSAETSKPSFIIIFSNVKEILEHQQYVFDTFWNKAIPADQRFTEIERGVDRTAIEVIPNSNRARELYLKLMKNAQKEIILMFPTINAFKRQERLGIFEFSKGPDIRVRILMPEDKSIYQTLQNLKDIHINFHIRYIEQTAGTHATFLVVDGRFSLVMEIRDDSKTTFDEAIGLSTYSNSKAGVLLYVGIFERLWKQSELYQKLKESEKLKDDFVNIAAHELRTPIQPILALTQLLRSQVNNVEQQELLEITIRNAKRLRRLTNDILDVTKIEARTLELYKEDFNLNDVVINAINDITLGTDSLKNENTRLSYNPQDILIHADKGRISQVISNLLGNAIKFTTQGTIFVGVEKNKNNNSVIVSVKDSGQGIDSTILPRLFTKFASKSYKGTGLVSSSFIEAHGGKIWAENNIDGKGATFAFTLPLNELTLPGN